MFEGYEGLYIRTVDYLIFLGQVPRPELSGRFPWLLSYMAQVISTGGRT